MNSLSFEWAATNHRLSVLQARPRGDDLEVAVIGGASTTGVVFDEGGECVSSSCSEFPFLDTSVLSARTLEVSSKRSVLASGSTSLIVGADGATQTLTIDLPRRARGEGMAVLAGLRIDTGISQALDSCYDPRHGWHFRRFAVVLGTPLLSDDGEQATLTVDASFEAGASFEDARACVDAVYEQAQIGLEVDVAVVFDPRVVPASEVISNEGAWERGEEQSAPDRVDIGSAPIAGWSTIDYRFHGDDPDGPRGAYLRSLAFELDPLAQTARGYATNEAPSGIQLSGFDYSFTGMVRSMDIRADFISRGYVDLALPATLDDAGEAVLVTLQPQ